MPASRPTSRMSLGIAALLLVTPTALASVKGGIDNRNGSISAFDGGSGDPAEFEWNVDPSDKYDPFTWNQTVQLGGRTATLVHSSSWFGANPATATTGFTISDSYTVSKPTGPGYASGNETTTMSLVVSGESAAVPFSFSGSINELQGDANVTLVGPGVNLSKTSSGSWNDMVALTNGEYTLTITMTALANTNPAATKSADVSVTLLSASAACSADAGSCYWPHAGGGCNDSECCDSVCTSDPTCCTVQWDADCATLANDLCAQIPASGIVINPANGHRYRLVTPGSWTESTSFSAASTLLGTFGCPVSIKDGFENQWVRCNLADNVPGIVGDTGPTDLFISEYYEGTGAANHAIEIYNGTSGAVDLTAGGYAIQVYTDGSATATTYALDGVVPSHGTWVAAPSNAAPTIIAKTNQELPTSFTFDGNDAIALVKNGAGLLDVVGQIGVNPGTEWGSGDASTANNTLRRKTSVMVGDANGADAFDPATQWDGFAAGDPSQLATHVADTSSAFSVWTGFNDVDAEGAFEWWCADPVTYTNWLPGEPNNGGNSDYCEMEGETGRWRDRGNAARLYGVTEFEFIQCGSGGGCFTTHATPGCNNESCCQTICFVDNYCCTNEWDTLCVNEATGLCSPGAIGGPFFNPANGHNYYLLDKGAWSEAQKAAASLGGTLAVINDAAENAWVLANVAQFGGDPNRNCFIGLHDQLTEGAFQWLDNSVVTYTNWDRGEPNNGGGDEDFAELLTDGTWRDNDNTGTNGFTTFAIVEVGCIGDLDANGVVDAADLAQLLGGWGGTSHSLDLNQDGIVDAADLAAMLGAWGSCV
jgi:hypothetical protein